MGGKCANGGIMKDVVKVDVEMAGVAAVISIYCNGLLIVRKVLNPGCQAAWDV